MKKILTLILVSVCALSSFAQKQNNIEKQKLILKKDNMNLSIYYPKFIGGQYAQTLNNAVYDMFLWSQLKGQQFEVKNDEQLRNLFLENGKQLAELGNQQSIAPFNYAHVAGWHYFQNKYVATLIINQYIDKENAHPDFICQDINLNMQGSDFDPYAIVKDTAKLMDIAAKMFCKQRKLPENAMRLQTGLNCELSDLPMANTCGFSSKGFVLFYNRGEIANHRVPVIHIVIPYSEFKHLLPADFFDSILQIQDGEAAGQAFINKLTRGDEKYIRKKQNRGGYRTY